MSRITNRFEHLKKQHRTALVTFITAGDPAPWVTVPLMHAMVQAGADILELGVPFSDPMAEGPVIQRASERAVANGVSLRQVLDMVTQFRKKDKDTPVILMGFGLNSDAIHSPNEHYGVFNYLKGIETISLFHHNLADLGK